MDTHVFFLIIRNEMKLQMRSWVFRFFVVLSLVGVVVCQMYRQGGDDIHWKMVGLPCSIPLVNAYLFSLVQEMHGTDVVFLGVSVDEAKDKQKWLDFIKKEELGGVQVHASGWSKIAQDYKIKGIPRFMVFDKQGRVVSVDAPRPSSLELKEMLEKELKK